MKSLSITDIAQKKFKNRSIWCVNTTSGDRRGRCIFRVHARGNESTIVEIPDTWLPIDLTTLTSRKSLLNSDDFRTLLRTEMAMLIREKDAQELLSKKGAEEEKDRLRKERSQVRAEQKANLAERANPSQLNRRGEEEDDGRSDLHSRVQTAEAVFQEKGDMGLINFLRPVEGELSQTDLAQLLVLAKKTGSENLEDYATAKMKAA